MKKDYKNIYSNRLLSAGYPDLEKLAVEYKTAEGSHSGAAEESHVNINQLMRCLEKLVDISQGLRTVLVIGCGPIPWTIKTMLDRGYEVVGIEPVAMSAAAAREFLGDPSRICQAGAESLPFDSGSQRFVLMEGVLEHVDSPILSLSEAYRVLTPGGVLYVGTTNKLQFSITGRSWEYNVKFYNWLPDLVKECYIHQHLHYDPTLANYSVRPAVHWFTFAGLCKLGRQVGFAKFYSRIDLIDASSRSKSAIKRWIFDKAKYNPWLRAMALTQIEGIIFMVKRAE